LKDVCGRKTCALKKLLAALSSVRSALHGGAKLKVLWHRSRHVLHLNPVDDTYVLVDVQKIWIVRTLKTR
jgi:hypothetical protein